jgi:hypothetical protein
MPKISLHVEADSADEYLTILTHIIPLAVVARHKNDWAEPFKDVEAKSDDAPVVEVHEMTAEETTEAVAQEDAVEAEKVALQESVDKKPRKPRGPNKPKKTPVTEDAPEEVEHVGTVAVAEEQGNGEVLTRMDLGDTIAGYVRKYGINFAQTDVSKMLQDMFGADVRKKSDVPDDQKSLKQAIATITQATIDNPYNRKVDVNG